MCPRIQATHQVLQRRIFNNLIHPDSRHSVNLRVVGFPFCTWLTDKLLQPVSFAFFFPNARKYISILCDQVVEQNLLLERLDISGCSSLTDTLLLRVTTSLKHICDLTL